MLSCCSWDVAWLLVLFVAVCTDLQAVKAKTRPRKTMFFEERKNCGNLIFDRKFCIASMF